MILDFRVQILDLIHFTFKRVGIWNLKIGI